MLRRYNTLRMTQSCCKGNNKIQQRGQFALSIILLRYLGYKLL